MDVPDSLDHDSFLTAAGVGAGYTLILAGITVLLFGVPLAVFALL